ncbi:MAG: hypothetical protein A2Z52_02930 [Candidatus Moranbacteria bacterium RBG_19FT_COMBO_42_6]|nr:MAG: hypothetical protein A2Z52_02930 [Candidatus Moranbacteria bacterium RBG_19FT_COMBO_42_6]
MPENEDLAFGTKIYHIKNIVQYADDDFDGVFPDDTAPNDYKNVKITVSWDGSRLSSSSVYLVSRFSPPSAEVDSGDGILSINVIDSTGSGVPQAAVHIVNNDVSPTVDFTQNTDNLGNLIFPGASQSIQGYQITVSKNEYETVSTVDPGVLDYIPIDDHASVIAGLINTKSITIDKLSDLKVKTLDVLGNSIPDVSFHLKGERILGTKNSVIPPETIYILDSDKNTNSSGELDLNDQNPGQIFLNAIETVSGYSLVSVSPISGFDPAASTYGIPFLPNEEKTVEIKFANSDFDSLLVKVLSNDDNSPINNAQVHLANASGYDTTVQASFDGLAFFPTDINPLVPGSYDIEVSGTGFGTYSGTVNIENLTNQEIKLSPE